jgi:hypothetical protein
MANKIKCATHGERSQTFVCTHLLGESAGLGFNRKEPTEEDPCPDAWCDDCELIRAAHDGWDEESEKLTKIVLLCSGCYERARIRNTHTSATLDDLKDLRWKCGNCEVWHTGLALDFGYDAPIYWEKKHDEENRLAKLLPHWNRNGRKTFLDEDFCAIDGEYSYVRGLIHLPIIGGGVTFRWAVWGSLSRNNFEKLLKMDGDPERVELAPMFSWLSNRIPEYPDTLNLKMYAHIQEPGQRPHFELEPTGHPLSQEYHHGISPERVKEIMLGRLGGNP